MNSKMPKKLASGLALGFILSLAVSAPFASAEEHKDRAHGDASRSAQGDGGRRDDGPRGNGGPRPAPQAAGARDIQPRSGNQPQFSDRAAPPPPRQGQGGGQPQYQSAADHFRGNSHGDQGRGDQGRGGNDRNDNRNYGGPGDRGDRGDRGGRFDYHGDRHFRDYNGVRFGFYFFPGRGYYRVPDQWYGHRWARGEFLPHYFYSYRIYDWDYYGLPIPPVGCGYIFVGTDAVLIDLYTGRVLDVIYDVY